MPSGNGKRKRRIASSSPSSSSPPPRPAPPPPVPSPAPQANPYLRPYRRGPAGSRRRGDAVVTFTNECDALEDAAERQWGSYELVMSAKYITRQPKCNIADPPRFHAADVADPPDEGSVDFSDPDRDDTVDFSDLESDLSMSSIVTPDDDGETTDKGTHNGHLPAAVQENAGASVSFDPGFLDMIKRPDLVPSDAGPGTEGAVETAASPRPGRPTQTAYRGSPRPAPDQDAADSSADLGEEAGSSSSSSSGATADLARLRPFLAYVPVLCFSDDETEEEEDLSVDEESGEDCEGNGDGEEDTRKGGVADPDDQGHDNEEETLATSRAERAESAQTATVEGTDTAEKRRVEEEDEADDEQESEVEEEDHHVLYQPTHFHFVEPVPAIVMQDQYGGVDDAHRLSIEDLTSFMNQQETLRKTEHAPIPLFKLAQPYIYGTLPNDFVQVGKMARPGASTTAFRWPNLSRNDALPSFGLVRDQQFGPDGVWLNDWVRIGSTSLPEYFGLGGNYGPRSKPGDMIHASLLDLDLVGQPNAGVRDLRLVSHVDFSYPDGMVIDATYHLAPVVSVPLSDATFALKIMPPLQYVRATRKVNEVEIQRAQVVVRHGGRTTYFAVPNVNLKGASMPFFDSATPLHGHTMLDVVGCIARDVIVETCCVTFGWDDEWNALLDEGSRYRFTKGLRQAVYARHGTRVAQEVMRYLLEPAELLGATLPETFTVDWQGRRFQELVPLWRPWRF